MTNSQLPETVSKKLYWESVAFGLIGTFMALGVGYIAGTGAL